MSKNEKNKTARVYFRVTEDEKKLISERAKAAGMSISKYILTISERKRLINPEPIVRLLIEINRIGNNINQIARVANSERSVSKNQIEAVERQMEYLNKKMEAMMNFVFASEPTPLPHSPDTIRYHLDEIESLLYEVLNKQEKQDGE